MGQKIIHPTNQSLVNPANQCLKMLAMEYVPMFPDTTFKPFVFDSGCDVSLDRDQNLCITMKVENEIYVYFKTHSYIEKEILAGDVQVCSRHPNDPDAQWIDDKYDCYELQDGLCVVEQAEGLHAPEGMIFKLSNDQMDRINEALAEINTLSVSTHNK